MTTSSRSGRATPAVSSITRLEADLGLALDPELAVLAVTHRSFAHEAGGLPTNERLEFLGDSVLGVIVTEYLFRHHPAAPEGELAKMRAACVSQRALAVVARNLRLGDYLLLGRGERGSGGADKDSILSDTLEAVIGATYLSHGLEPTRVAVLALLVDSLGNAADAGAGLDWKTSLQERTSALGVGVPTYEVVSTGPDHARVFTARVLIDGVVRGSGTGSAKKYAEQDAAHEAFTSLTAAAADTVARPAARAATGDRGQRSARSR